MCYDMHEHNAFIDQDFHEDSSLLLTLGKLHQFRSDGNNPLRFFKHSVRLNAYKEAGIWYETQKLQGGDWNMMGSVQKLSSFDFGQLGAEALYDLGQDGDGLIFNPLEIQLKLANSSYKYPFVCTHKAELRMGKSSKPFFGKYLLMPSQNLLLQKVLNALGFMLNVMTKAFASVANANA